MIERLIQLEEDIRYQQFAQLSEPEFIHIKGSIPILISAPHGAAHIRNGKDKEEDEFTGGLAQLIGQETGAHVLYARRKSTTDPNVDPKAPYKEKIAEIVNENSIIFVLDIHGVGAHRNHGIELGTARGKSCSEQERELIVQTLEEYGFIPNRNGDLTTLLIDEMFAGAGNDNEERVIQFVRQKLNTSAAQFEINAHLRIPKRRPDATQKDKSFKGNPDLIVRTVHAFTAIVTRLADHYVQSI